MSIEDRRDYSVYKEEANRLIEKFNKIRQIIEEKNNRILEFRNGKEPNTLTDITEEMREVAEGLSHTQKTDKYFGTLFSGYEKMKRFMEQAVQELDLEPDMKKAKMIKSKILKLNSIDKNLDRVAKEMFVSKQVGDDEAAFLHPALLDDMGLLGEDFDKNSEDDYDIGIVDAIDVE